MPLLIEQLEEAIVGFLLREGEHYLSDQFLGFVLSYVFAHLRDSCDRCGRSLLFHAVGVFNGNLSHNFFHTEDDEDEDNDA